MSLELKRKKLELVRVQTARMELEFKIEERLEEIERLRENIRIQKAKEDDLLKELKEN